MSTETTKVAPMFNVVAINVATGNKIVLTGYPEKHHEACVILSKTMPATGNWRKCVEQLVYPEGWNHEQLFSQLGNGKSVKIECWGIMMERNLIWLTNPYGIDVACFKANVHSCATILNRIATDDHEREWF